MAKPSFRILRAAYDQLLTEYPDHMPCDGGWDNQCAIRMSIVLNQEKTVKINKETYSEPKCSHGHARGAESLANFLVTKIGYPKVYKDPAAAKITIAEQTGILFFKDCFQRTGETTARGDHIDLWDRGLTMTYDDPGNKAKQLWFWQLP
ncbi:MAG: hypothetical protein JWQ36_2645 [Enterovirga sp.]|jgi:heat shock protein HslJ|nr:hypothetical protein [Enterovirga sp.]